ncbi:MAG: hypothetical protein NT020_06385 [Chloroflexales bacterium]|nr:hypothetical protein [Chloroflexales bacterium]
MNRYRGLAALYAFWALAVMSRVSWQYATHLGNHLPTHLSAITGIIYVLIAYWAWQGWTKALQWGLIVELIGVIVVGTYELFYPFGYATAWSHYGAGYLYMPLLLPIAGIVVVWRNRKRRIDVVTFTVAWH